MKRSELAAIGLNSEQMEYVMQVHNRELNALRIKTAWNAREAVYSLVDMLDAKHVREALKTVVDLYASQSEKED